MPGIGGPERSSHEDGGADRGVSAEEFALLQDELMALKMYSEELLNENRRLFSQEPRPSPTVAPPPSPPLTALPAAVAFRKQMSAFGKGLAKLTEGLDAQVSNASRLYDTPLAAVPKPVQNVSPPGSPDCLAEQLDEQDREALRAEAEYLKSRIRATIEEAEEFRTVAADAQHVVAAAERAARAARALPPEVPAVTELRSKVLDDLGGGPAEKAVLVALSDELLVLVAKAALGLLQPGGIVACDEGSSAGEPEHDEETLMLKRKVEANQHELKRLMEMFHRQQEQIVSLQGQVFPNEENAKNKDLRNQTKEKLKEAERQVEELTQQLEASEQGASASQELRDYLRQSAQEAIQRDQILAEMRSLSDVQESDLSLLRERLGTTLGDIAGLASRHAERTAGTSPRSSARRRAAAPGAAADGAVGCGAASPSASSTAAPEVLGAFADAAVEAKLGQYEDLATLRDRQRLKTELDDLLVAKAVLEKRTARELRELRALMPQPKPKPKPRAAPHGPHLEGASGTMAGGAGSGSQPVLAFDISSDGEDGQRRVELPTDEVELPVGGAEPEYSEEQLLMQRISELEQRTDVLRRALEALYEAERGLKAENKEKSELLAYLLERVDKRRPPPTGAAAAVGKAVFVPPGVAAEAERQRQAEGPSMHRQEHRGSSEEDIAEMESVVDELQEDNIRLRNDIKTMSDEFRQVLMAVGGAAAATAAVGGAPKQAKR